MLFGKKDVDSAKSANFRPGLETAFTQAAAVSASKAMHEDISFSTRHKNVRNSLA